MALNAIDILTNGFLSVAGIAKVWILTTNGRAPNLHFVGKVFGSQPNKEDANAARQQSIQSDNGISGIAYFKHGYTTKLKCNLE